MAAWRTALYAVVSSEAKASGQELGQEVVVDEGGGRSNQEGVDDGRLQPSPCEQFGKKAELRGFRSPNVEKGLCEVVRPGLRNHVHESQPARGISAGQVEGTGSEDNDANVEVRARTRGFDRSKCPRKGSRCGFGLARITPPGSQSRVDQGLLVGRSGKMKGFKSTALGSTVHAVVERTPWKSRTTVVTATDTVSSADLPVTGDQITVTVSGANNTDGYRLLLTGLGGTGGSTDAERRAPFATARPETA